MDSVVIDYNFLVLSSLLYRMHHAVLYTTIESQKHIVKLSK